MYYLYDFECHMTIKKCQDNVNSNGQLYWMTVYGVNIMMMMMVMMMMRIDENSRSIYVFAHA